MGGRDLSDDRLEADSVTDMTIRRREGVVERARRLIVGLGVPPQPMPATRAGQPDQILDQRPAHAHAARRRKPSGGAVLSGDSVFTVRTRMRQTAPGLRR